MDPISFSRRFLATQDFSPGSSDFSAPQGAPALARGVRLPALPCRNPVDFETVPRLDLPMKSLLRLAWPALSLLPLTLGCGSGEDSTLFSGSSAAQSSPASASASTGSGATGAGGNAASSGVGTGGAAPT